MYVVKDSMVYFHVGIFHDYQTDTFCGDWSWFVFICFLQHLCQAMLLLVNKTLALKLWLSVSLQHILGYVKWNLCRITPVHNTSWTLPISWHGNWKRKHIKSGRGYFVLILPCIGFCKTFQFDRHSFLMYSSDFALQGSEMLQTPRICMWIVNKITFISSVHRGSSDVEFQSIWSSLSQNKLWQNIAITFSQTHPTNHK